MSPDHQTLQHPAPAPGPATTRASPSVPAPTARRGFDPAVQGMRGAVLLGIVVFHAWQFTGSGQRSASSELVDGLVSTVEWAVSWFFITSGYLLYASFARRVLDGRSAGTTGDFLQRRLVRVLPAYWVAIVVVWVARNPSFPGDWRDLLEHLTFTHGFDTQRIFWTIGPAWTMTTEVCFYAVLALAWRPVQRWCAPLGRPARLAVLSVLPALLVVGGIAYQVWAVRASGAAGDDWAVWFSPAAQMPAFGVGMFMGLALILRRPVVRGRVLGALLDVGPFAALVALATWDSETVLPGRGATMAVHDLMTLVFAAMLLASLLRPAGRGINRLWAWPALVYAGTISFSVYLWHEPALLLMEHWGVVSGDQSLVFVVLVLVAAAVAIGTAGFFVVERPLRALSVLLPYARTSRW